MSQLRKNLKILSIVVLAFAGLTALNIVFELIFGEINNAAIPEGSPDNILLIAKIFLVVLSFIILLPQVYIGIKGIKVANKPDNSRGHIVWGIILFVLSLVGLISPVMAIFKREDIFSNLSALFSGAVDAAILFAYVKYARSVAEEN